jgi:hypothetical protein
MLEGAGTGKRLEPSVNAAILLRPLAGGPELRQSATLNRICRLGGLWPFALTFRARTRRGNAQRALNR